MSLNVFAGLSLGLSVWMLKSSRVVTVDTFYEKKIDKIISEISVKFWGLYKF